MTEFRPKRAGDTVRSTSGASLPNRLLHLCDELAHWFPLLDDRLQAINRPTLVLWGRDDKLIPLNFGERFHQEIANSRFRIIDNCGHMPQVERPDEFANALLQF